MKKPLPPDDGRGGLPGRSEDRLTAFQETIEAGLPLDISKDKTVSFSTKPPGDISTDETIAYASIEGDAAVAIKLADDRYRVRGVLGAGGMGEVRAVSDAWIGRDVAKKTLLRSLRDSTAARQRFLREIRVQGQLEHPGIVPVYDVGVGEGGELSFTMRRVKGTTLAAIVEGLAAEDQALVERFSRRKLLTAFSAVCMTVHYAHTRGVVHRDLKPGNVMLGDFGEVYVLDWGIAKLLTEEASVSDYASAEISTEGRRVVGTLGYMAPEQASGENDSIDARTDVYALGVILFELLALENVLTGLDARAAFRAVTEGVDARPTTRPRGADVPPELETICVRATAFDRDGRYPSARALSEAVERYLDGDRDLERRRELAAEYAAKAGELAQRALAAATPPTEAHAARVDAMRSTLHALGLSPEQPEAQRTLARLVMEVPKDLPPEAEADHEAVRVSARTDVARLGMLGYISYLAAFPVMVIMGVKSWPVIGVGFALTLLAAVLCYLVYSRRAVDTRSFTVLLAVSTAVVSMQSAWLGPFVMVPASATLTVMLFTLYASKVERLTVIGLGAAMFLVPFAGELLGLFPPAFSFEPGRVVLHERALSLSRNATVLALLYSCTGYILLPVLYIGRLRDALGVIEDRQFLQAWYLKRMFPKARVD
jgi:serine/threonine-protein kinase